MIRERGIAIGQRIDQQFASAAVDIVRKKFRRCRAGCLEGIVIGNWIENFLERYFLSIRREGEKNQGGR